MMEAEDGLRQTVLRQRLRERFESWLDEVLARPEPPAGVAADLLAELEAEEADAVGAAPGDLYSLWSAMTGLTQEVKLQGRAFQRLTGELAPLADLGPALDEGRERHEEALTEARQVAEKALGERTRREALTARRQTIEVLLDLRDRLARGRETARAHLEAIPDAPPWPLRLSGHRAGWEQFAAATEALAKGYALSLERLEEELDRLGVQALESLGHTFDPHTMTAVDIEVVPPRADGKVLEVYRPGYACQGDVLRPARVKVGRTK